MFYHIKSLGREVVEQRLSLMRSDVAWDAQLWTGVPATSWLLRTKPYLSVGPRAEVHVMRMKVLHQFYIMSRLADMYLRSQVIGPYPPQLSGYRFSSVCRDCVCRFCDSPELRGPNS